MENLLERIWIYWFPPNDWRVIKHNQDKCIVDYHDNGYFLYTDTKTRHFYIKYSEFRKLYKVEMEGYKAKNSYLYGEFLNEVIELNNKLWK